MSKFSLLSPWIPVTVDLPPFGMPVIGAYSEGDDSFQEICVSEVRLINGGTWLNGKGECLSVHAFMPFPDPPLETMLPPGVGSLFKR